jgi:DNA-binding Lrp family transcriptional regulator
MTMRRLDDVDRLIVQELTADVRITYAELGARVGLSESQCLRRIRALEQANVICGYLTMVDPAFLNRPVCAFIELRLRGANNAKVAEFERMADLRRDVASCWRVSGDADYVLQCFVPDPQCYERLLNAVAGIDGVLIVRTHLVLRVAKRSPRLPSSSLGARVRLGTAISTISDHLRAGGAASASHSSKPRNTILANRNETAPRRQFDELDRRILRTLANNARMSNVQLAAGVGLSPAPCLRRVRALEAAGVVQGYYLHFDLDALNLIVFFVTIRVTTQNTGWHETFGAALSDVPEVLSAFRTNGGSDYVLICMASGLDGIETFLSSKALSWPGIDSFQSLLALRYCNHFDLEKLHDAGDVVAAPPLRQPASARRVWMEIGGGAAATRGGKP